MVEPVADREHQGAPAGESHERRIGAEPERSGERPEAVVDQVLASESGDDREVAERSGQRLDRSVVPPAAADDRERALGSVDEFAHPCQRDRVDVGGG